MTQEERRARLEELARAAIKKNNFLTVDKRIFEMLVDCAEAAQREIVEACIAKLVSNREALDYGIPHHNSDDPRRKEFEIMSRVYLMAEEEIRGLLSADAKRSEEEKKAIR